LSSSGPCSHLPFDEVYAHGEAHELEPDHPEVSVIIAAFDIARWSLLQRAVESACNQSIHPQVVVAIDNNQILFHRASEAFDGVEVVLNERNRGASATRNTGAAAASGRILAFLDDDAEASDEWLARLIDPLIKNPSVIGVGGGVVPSWPSAQPKWFPTEFGWVVGASYTGLPKSVTPVRNVWSENMAVRASEFHRVGGFREGFGKIGNSSRPEDTEFCLRIQSEHPGTKWLYDPDAIITHHVPENRATFGFFMRRCIAEGRGKAHLAQYVGRSKALATERSYVVHSLVTGVLTGARQTYRGDFTGVMRSGAIVLGGILASLGYVTEAVNSMKTYSSSHNT